MSKAREDKLATGAMRGRKGEKDVGAVLKRAYERTLREEIPPDLLDLLGKLD